MIDAALLSILVCPESKQPVKPVDLEGVERINAAIRAHVLKNRAGRGIDQEIDGALLRADGRVAYPVRDDIPVMLIDEGFEIPAG